MKKGIIAILIALAAIGVGAFFLLAPKPATAALLYVDQGTVEVDQGGGWGAAEDESELRQGNKVRTRQGEATLVFYEGEIMQLKPFTEVAIDTLRTREITLTQLSGETWNKLTRISGVQEYSVSTPTTVATVRGTEFTLNDTEIAVNEGRVDYWRKENSRFILTVHAGNRATAAELKELPLEEKHKASFIDFKKNYINVLKNVRYREIKKHQTLMDMAATRGFTEEKLNSSLHKIDNGQLHEDELYQQVPVLLRPRATRAYQLTKQIKKATQALP